MKTILVYAVLFVGLAGSAIAQEAQAPVGEHSANAAAPATGNVDDSTDFASTRSFSSPGMRAQEDEQKEKPTACVLGYYSTYISCQSVPSGR